MSKKIKLLIATGVATASFLIAGTAVVLIAGWFDHNRIVFHSPIELAFFQPVKVEERKPEYIKEVITLDYPGEIDTPIEKYICQKWGAFDCKTALAVSKAEVCGKDKNCRIEDNFETIGINENSIDAGIFQINSVHFKQPGCSLKEILDPYKNADCAYQIWEASGWSPWVAWNNDNFKSHL
jgi:hypothetical protein